MSTLIFMFTSLSPQVRCRKWSLMGFLVDAFVLLQCARHAQAMHVHYRTCGGNPRHVHLAVGQNPSEEMIVTFASIPSKYPDHPIAAVLVGTSLNDMKTWYFEMEDSPTYYNTTSLHGGNYGDHEYYSPYYHHILLNGLKPKTTYYYQVLIQPTIQDFEQKYNSLLRGKSATIISGGHNYTNFHEIELALLESDRESKEQVDEEEEEDVRRFLGSQVPYDARQHDCASADKIRTFQTAPVEGSFPVNLAIIGDIGQFPHSEEALARMLREHHSASRMASNSNKHNQHDDDETERAIDAILLAGDIAYANLDHRRWDTFFDFLDDYPISQHVPMMIVPGNHDIEKQENGSGIFQAYEYRFRMPRLHQPILGTYEEDMGQALNMDRPPYPLPYEWGNAYYSMTYGAVRILMVSSYSSLEPNSTQYNWILHELSNVDRSVTPWVIVVLHCPIYNTFGLHQHDYQIVAGKQHLEPLVIQYKVNMVFSGHIHAYLRTKAVKQSVVDPTGPVHITVGSGGRNCEAPFLNKEPEEWVGVRDSTIYGYGMFRIVNQTHAEWDWIHVAHADDGRNYNQLYHSNETLPPGPGRDTVWMQNQYYL